MTLRENLSGNGHGRIPFDPIETAADLAFKRWLESDQGRRIANETLNRALRLHSRGVRHFGLKAIFESIRFDWAVGGEDDTGFKVNNTHAPRLARKLMEEHPGLDGLFETRILRS